MDATTRDLIKQITVRYDSPQEVPGGHVCSVFYDCAQLAPNGLVRLAAQAVGSLPSDAFEVAIGLAPRGVFFSAAVAGGRQVGFISTVNEYWGADIQGKKVVLVDDVVCTGNSFRRAREVLEPFNVQLVGYAVIVNRADDPDVKIDGLPVRSAYQTKLE